MPRPKTGRETFSFRLKPRIVRAAAKEAKKRGQTAAEFLEASLLLNLLGTKPKPSEGTHQK